MTDCYNIGLSTIQGNPLKGRCHQDLDSSNLIRELEDLIDDMEESARDLRELMFDIRQTLQYGELTPDERNDLEYKVFDLMEQYRECEKNIEGTNETINRLRGSSQDADNATSHLIGVVAGIAVFLFILFVVFR